MRPPQTPATRPHSFFAAIILLAALALVSSPAAAEPNPQQAALFQKTIEPILVDYCFDCHDDASEKGSLSFESYESLTEHFDNHDLWLAVWKNLRAGTMPPPEKSQPSKEQRKEITGWIQRQIFKVDPDNPDPGRVTIRRLNRTEYENTIRDLTGVDFDATDAFPADDTGYGFDNIGDVLSLSPLLMEKYLNAAREIVAESVHTEGPYIPTIKMWGSNFRNEDKRQPRDVPFEKSDRFTNTEQIEHAGEYEVRAEVQIKGSSEATSHSANFTLLKDDKPVLSRELGWDFNKSVVIRGKVRLEKGGNNFTITLKESEPPEENEKHLDLYVYTIDLRGPLDGSHRVYPDQYHAVFTDGPPEDNTASRKEYARKLIRNFADRAYRRPIDDESLEKLVAIAQSVDAQPNRTFEDGVAQAYVAILASPRFLFRAETQPQPNNPGKIIPVDEFALASRLSYFLWSSMPDDELFRLARENKLRANLRSQIDRMLVDPKAESIIDNFVGQWLLTRNVQTIDIDPRRLTGERNLGKAFRIFSQDLRSAMRRETEMLIAHLLKENRPAHELLNADYTFLNEKLANWYKIPGVKGSEMRLVKIDPKHKRKGLLTHASLHIVTSNPTETSPVKRGLYVLDNILGTPAPPPPPDIPELEEAKEEAGHSASKRELLALHASKALCASCHERFDPLGLALENFDVGGRWRDKDHGAPIDPAGQLMTGEKFNDVFELADILSSGDRRTDFYRCFTEKLYTYALGRGTEYYDIPVIDKIVANSEKSGGYIREIIYQIVESPAFQKRRGDGDRLAAKN
ncbi:MAG: DUF1592 domain-containing protein [Verrucomicrobiota bacterium]